MTTVPLPEGDPASGMFDNLQPIVGEFVETIKGNRATKTLDRIVCVTGNVDTSASGHVPTADNAAA